MRIKTTQAMKKNHALFRNRSHSAINWERSAPRQHPDFSREKANMLNIALQKIYAVTLLVAWEVGAGG